jgi:hypothetical protein
MQMHQIPDTSGRFENKYALPATVATQVLEHARQFLSPDRGLDGPQRISSLYLETPDLTFYQWHNDRRADRFKLRIRGYGEALSRSVYLEIKRKSGELVRKRRAEVQLAKLSRVLAGAESADSSALREFLKVHREFDVQPKVLISCLRTAFRGRNAYGEVAVTADREIVCQPAFRYELVGDQDAWRPLVLPGEAVSIVELKYVHEPPAWMVGVMSQLLNHRVRFSKYATAMEQHVAPQKEPMLQAA